MANQAMKLTKSTVERIRRDHEPGKRLRVWAEAPKGFFLRITEKGSAAYCVRVKRAQGAGKADVTLIGADEAGPDIARDMARDELERARKGEPDRVTRRKLEKERAESDEQETFAALSKAFMDAPEKKPPQLSPRTYNERRRLLDTHILPSIGTMLFGELRRKEVRSLVRSIQKVAASHPRARKYGIPSAKLANECHSLIKCIFNWAQLEELTEANPGIFPKLFKDAPKKRPQMPIEALSEAFRLLDQQDRGKQTALIIKLHAVTLQRPHAITKANADQFDWTEGAEMWRIPASVSKTNECYEVPLSGLAVELFKEAFQTSGCGWAFPNTARTGPIRHDAAKQRWIRLRNKAIEQAKQEGRTSPLEGVELYDCRRLGRTRLVHQLGFSERVAEACLSHTEGRTDFTRYDVAPIGPMKREALSAWAVYLQRVLVNHNETDK